MRLASRGSRKITDVEEKIEDEAELAHVRRQAQRVYVKSILAAVVMTLIVLMLPK